MTDSAEQKVITISLPTDAYFMSGIRDFTLTMVRSMTGMSDQWAYRFQSVIDELCNNAIEHGSAPGALVTVKFISEHDKRLEVIVEDTGTGPHPLKAKELSERVDAAKDIVTQPGAHIGLRGRGLAQIVSSWTDELHFTDLPSGGIQVRAVKYLDRAQEETATGFVTARGSAFDL